jgi:hypothetical protein
MGGFESKPKYCQKQNKNHTQKQKQNKYKNTLKPSALDIFRGTEEDITSTQ